MEAMEDYDDDQEELLCLSLAINVGDYSGNSTTDQRKRKRIRRSFREINLMSPPINSSIISHNSCEGNFEGKVFRLLQMRERMLKQDQLLHKKRLISSLSPTLQDHHDHHDHEKNPTGLHLIHLLLVAATAAAEGPTATTAAFESLSELYAGGVSLTGDSVQRVVAHFADGLAARLLTRHSPFFDVIMRVPPPEEELSAFISLYRASPFYQFAHFTANQAIVEAFERDQEGDKLKENDNNHGALHVIDFDVSYGFQWPSLIQSLAEKASGGARISLRITGLGRSRNELRETENRLVSFSKSFRNLSFEFRGLLRSSSGNTNSFVNDLINGFKCGNNETVAVNFLFHSNNVAKRGMSETLKLIRERLNPSVVVLVEKEGSTSVNKSSSRSSFLPRFMESLHYFAAMFDSLDDGLPRDSAERLGIEKNHLGREIKAMLIDNNGDRCAGERFESWKERMLSHGFRGIRISSKALIQAKLLLKMRAQYCCFPQGEANNGGGCGFRVFEKDEGRAVSLGWQNRCLITASVWRCVCDS